jgi:TldD protein
MLVDQTVIEEVLDTALKSGGHFAEVFAEDRRATGARLDDGRVEDLASGRERGAGTRAT